MNRLNPILFLLPLTMVAPAGAQTMDHMSMPGMSMPMPAAKTQAKPAKAPRARKPGKARAPHYRRRRAAHIEPSMSGMPTQGAMRPGMPGMPGMTMAPNGPHPTPSLGEGMTGMQVSTPPPAGGTSMAATPGMTGMDMSGAAQGQATPDANMSAPSPASDPEIPNAPPPPPPKDHASDRFFDPAAMAASRAQLRREHGGEPWSMVMANLAEYQARQRGGGYRWEGEASFGGDINRFYLKSEGEGSNREGVEAAEVQALYSRAIGPYFNLQAGVRQDFRPNPDRTYATVGFEGLAPYLFDISGAAFLSTKGEVLGRLEGYEDFRITQRLILQPRAELNLSAQDVPELGVGSGITNLELGLRLRYEITRQVAPYIGMSYDRKFGATADFARARGERAGTPSLVFGVRTWF
jgi:copper resistance protein B